MNREIKFRGQCAVSKEMVYGDLIHGVGFKKGNIYILPDKVNLAYVKHCDSLDGVKVIPETVGQFIGLQDIMGVNIFEGDVIRTINENLGVVVAKDHAFEVTVSKSQSSLYMADWMSKSEVIGNIHQNPELLDELKIVSHGLYTQS